MSMATGIRWGNYRGSSAETDFTRLVKSFFFRPDNLRNGMENGIYAEYRLISMACDYVNHQKYMVNEMEENLCAVKTNQNLGLHWTT